MKDALTAYQLANLAAKFGTTLTPADAVARALAIYEAADNEVRADEIAVEKEKKRLLGLGENLDEWIPIGSRISIAAALQYLDQQPAGKPFKSESRLLRALRKDSLALDVNGVWNTSIKLLETFRETRLAAERGRKKDASKQKMGGTSHTSKRKMKSQVRNAPAGMLDRGRKKRSTKRKSND
jgi:hypothetical protein